MEICKSESVFVNLTAIMCYRKAESLKRSQKISNREAFFSNRHQTEHRAELKLQLTYTDLDDLGLGFRSVFVIYLNNTSKQAYLKTTQY